MEFWCANYFIDNVLKKSEYVRKSHTIKVKVLRLVFADKINQERNILRNKLNV